MAGTSWWSRLRRVPAPVVDAGLALAVLLASAALQLYGLTNYPGILPAVPLSVAVAPAWIAGYRRWTLAISATTCGTLSLAEAPGGSPPRTRPRTGR